MCTLVHKHSDRKEYIKTGNIAKHNSLYTSQVELLLRASLNDWRLGVTTIYNIILS